MHCPVGRATPLGRSRIAREVGVCCPANMVAVRRPPCLFHARMTSVPDQPNSSAPGRFTVGAKVWFRDGAGGDHIARLPGTVVEDYGDEVAANAHLGRDWAPVRRWAVALDEGRLVFSDGHDLEDR